MGTFSNCRTISTLRCNGVAEGREAFRFLVLPDWFLALQLRPNGTNNSLLKLLCLLEEKRDLFQFQELLALFQDLLLRPNGTNNSLLKLLCLLEERRDLFQFQELLDLFPDLLLKLNGTNNSLHRLLWLLEERKGLFPSLELFLDLTLVQLLRLSGINSNLPSSPKLPKCIISCC